ncbi:MAG: T9SS type A sorting domain-containing protein [Bacteroidetes bacterium]|nr:T9SS type A sorting domain-containing protein [Bacteroidota bacterium]
MSLTETENRNNDIQIMDAMGKIYYKKENVTEKSIIWHSDKVPSGIYFVKTTNSKTGKIITQKITKL